jgi:hypothetical protein
MKRILVACLLIGCSKGDDCQKLVDKMMPVMKEMASKSGKNVDMDKGKDEFLQNCRKDDKMKNDPTMKCVLDAKDEAAVKECIAKPMNDYAGRSKQTEAMVQLNALSKHAKMVFGESGAFPTGTAKELPANDKPGCCGQPDNKCPASTEWASDPVWKALDFSIDQPGMYRYKYTSDGKTFTASATGDLDCDGKPAIFMLTGKVDNGAVTTDVVKPPDGLY